MKLDRVSVCQPFSQFSQTHRGLSFEMTHECNRRCSEFQRPTICTFSVAVKMVARSQAQPSPITRVPLKVISLILIDLTSITRECIHDYACGSFITQTCITAGLLKATTHMIGLNTTEDPPTPSAWSALDHCVQSLAHNSQLPVHS